MSTAQLMLGLVHAAAPSALTPTHEMATQTQRSMYARLHELEAKIAGLATEQKDADVVARGMVSKTVLDGYDKPPCWWDN